MKPLQVVATLARASGRPRRRVLLACLTFLGIPLAFATGAEAAAPTLGGSVVQIAPPASVVPGALESNSQIRFFKERSAILLNQSITVEITQPSIVDQVVDLTPGQIAANQLVDSYFLHTDTLAGSGIVTFQGSVVFDAPVLGILVLGSSLDATDAVLGSPSTAYFSPSNIYRGFDGPDFSTSSDAVRDLVQLSLDRRTITLQLRTEAFTDQVRVITAVVPEPTSLALAAGCLLWGTGAQRRRGS
jgi:hypothetical protein